MVTRLPSSRSLFKRYLAIGVRNFLLFFFFSHLCFIHHFPYLMTARWLICPLAHPGPEAPNRRRLIMDGKRPADEIR